VKESVQAREASKKGKHPKKVSLYFVGEFVHILAIQCPLRVECTTESVSGWLDLFILLPSGDLDPPSGGFSREEGLS